MKQTERLARGAGLPLSEALDSLIFNADGLLPVIAQQQGADSASVIYDAVQAAEARGIDVVLADTAGRLIAVFEPHRYSRVHDLFAEFSACFRDADSVIVGPLYTAGEQPIRGIDHHRSYCSRYRRCHLVCADAC